MATTPLVDREIGDVVQEDVGKDRLMPTTLRRIPVRLLLLAALKNASSQLQPDEL